MELTPAQRARIRACLDPTRIRILESLSRVPGSSQSLARRLGLSQPRVHYHLRRLEAVGLIALAEERRKRGVVERLFAATGDALAQASRAVSEAAGVAPELPAFCAALSQEAPDPEEPLVTELHTLRLSRREARHLQEDLLRRIRELQARPAPAGEREYRIGWAIVPR